jgi:hypothetical protein
MNPEPKVVKYLRAALSDAQQVVSRQFCHKSLQLDKTMHYPLLARTVGLNRIVPMPVEIGAAGAVG